MNGHIINNEAIMKNDFIVYTKLSMKPNPNVWCCLKSRKNQVQTPDLIATEENFMNKILLKRHKASLMSKKALNL